MMSKLSWLLKQFTSQLWLRATLFCGIGIFTALVALLIKDFIPEDISRKVGAEAVDTILHILANSMLAVTTFSLSTMVAAYAAASTSTTPRATKLLLEDRTAQNALSTFIGSFLFSLVGIIALQMGVYGDSGRLVLLVVTLGVIFVITAMLLQWISHLTQLGRVGKTIDMVEKAAQKAIAQRLTHPYLGGVQLRDTIPQSTHHPITHATIGHIQHIDMQQLQELAERFETELFFVALPGSFNDSCHPILYSSTMLEEEKREAICNAFSIGGDRTFEYDPRYGLIVLSEIASRALSPAVNDPGTAIDIIGTSLRLLTQWVRFDTSDKDVLYARLHVPGMQLEDVFDDIFTPIARDGAGMVEVGIRLQKTYRSLSRLNDAECRKLAHTHSALALKRAAETLKISEDMETLKALAL